MMKISGERADLVTSARCEPWIQDTNGSTFFLKKEICQGPHPDNFFLFTPTS
jgi:hypothetical protein